MLIRTKFKSKEASLDSFELAMIIKHEEPPLAQSRVVLDRPKQRSGATRSVGKGTWGDRFRETAPALSTAKESGGEPVLRTRGQGGCDGLGCTEGKKEGLDDA
jgi:hypothetical protein